MSKRATRSQYGRGKRSARLRVVASMLVATFCAAAVAQSVDRVAAQSAAAASERSIKAAFLYKFAGYVQWPEGDAVDDALRIGVAEAEEFAAELGAMTAGRTVSDRAIEVRSVSVEDALDGLHVLFVGGGAGNRQRELLVAVAGRPVLTVTENENGLADGSVINFTVEDERVRFEVALDAAERQGLKLNARLLSVAKEVHREVPR